MSELIDRQAVLDALSNAVPSLTTPDGCGQFDRELQIVGETLVDAMQIVHALPAASPWHRVEEPPKKTAKYLVWVDVNNGVFAAYPELRTAAYNVVYERWYVDGDQRTEWIGTPRYWMPIEPPKEDEP